ncbi:MAG: hypothetical protein Kapaf2KO_00590 [Candidatus Kapaibacteriales bacterium]
MNTLQSKKNDLTRQRTFFNQLNTRLNTFITQLDSLSADNIGSKFSSKKVESSDDSFVTATASPSSAKGTNSIKVKRLASNDILISNRIDSGSSLGLSGTQTITFRGTEGNNVELSIELTGDETAQEAMKLLADTINDSEELGLVAGNVKDTESTSRLSIRSENSGTSNSIVFADSNLLSALGIETSLFADTSSRTIAGKQTAGFKQADVSLLNSLADINGIEVVRSTNNIDDAIEGMTFELKKVQDESDGEILLETDANRDAVDDLINPFISAYNGVMSFLTSAEGRNMRRSDPSISSLYQKMRFILSERVTTQIDGGPEYLANIGLDVNSNGTLSLTNSERLYEILETDPEFISNLFSSADGVVAKMQAAVETLKGDDGLITQKTLSISDQIDAQDDRIEQLNNRIDRQAESLRKQYTNLLEALFEQEGQTSAFNVFSQGAGLI